VDAELAPVPPILSVAGCVKGDAIVHHVERDGAFLHPELAQAQAPGDRVHKIVGPGVPIWSL
jgi:hypothetical protein